MSFLISLVIGAFLVLTGIYFRTPGATWLTGYKVTSERERSNIDWLGYTRIFGNTAIAIGVLVILGWLIFEKLLILDYYGIYLISLLIILGILKSLIFNYFNHNMKLPRNK